MMREAKNLGHLRREHGPLIREFVGTTIRIELLDTYFQRTGLLRAGKGGLETHPAFKARIHLSNLLCRLTDLLGLNPTSAALLKLSDPIDVGGDPALALQDALERREREAEKAEAAEGAPGEGGPS